jgi:hypothetical protein
MENSLERSVRAERRHILSFNDRELLAYYANAQEQFSRHNGFWETLRYDTAKAEVLRRMAGVSP